MSLLSKIGGFFTGRPAAPLPPPGPAPDAPGTVRDWTVLTYGAGNAADLDWHVHSAVQAFGDVGTDKRVAFAAQVARHSEGGRSQRLSFGAPRCEGDYNVKVEADLGVINTGDGKNLEDFLRWGIEKYPAKHYLVVLNGHGGAFQGGYPDTIAGDHLDQQELREAMQAAHAAAGRKIDVLLHASCFMGSVETAHSVQEDVELMVASEAISTARCPNLWSVGQKLKHRAGQGDVSPADVVNICFESIERLTAESVTRLSNMPGLTAKVKLLADRLVHTATPDATVKSVMRRAVHFGAALQGLEPPPAVYGQVRDLSSLALQLAQAPEIQDQDLKVAAAAVAEGVFGPVVVGGRVSGDAALRGCKGLSVWAPTSPAEAGKLNSYAQTSFARETGWDGVVRRYGVADV